MRNQLSFKSIVFVLAGLSSANTVRADNFCGQNKELTIPSYQFQVRQPDGTPATFPSSAAQAKISLCNVGFGSHFCDQFRDVVVPLHSIDANTKPGLFTSESVTIKFKGRFSDKCREVIQGVMFYFNAGDPNRDGKVLELEVASLNWDVKNPSGTQTEILSNFPKAGDTIPVVLKAESQILSGTAKDVIISSLAKDGERYFKGTFTTESGQVLNISGHSFYTPIESVAERLKAAGDSGTKIEISGKFLDVAQSNFRIDNLKTRP